MEIAYWKCKTCQGEEAPCLSVILGNSLVSVVPTKCLQDVATTPEWQPIVREDMDRIINDRRK